MDGTSLAGLLDRARVVFNLARKLGQAFQQEHEHQRRTRVADPASWNRYRRDVEKLYDSLLELHLPMQIPPVGFAPVANVLVVAARVAKEIRNSVQSADGRTRLAHLDFFPDLNSVFFEGSQAIEAVVRAQKIEDSNALVNEPSPWPRTLAELLRCVVRRLQANPDLLRGYQWDHPDTLNITELNARAMVLGLGPIFAIGDAPDWVRAPNLPANDPVTTKRIESLTVRHPDGSEYRIRRTGGQLDDSSSLPTTETIARLEAWIERVTNLTRLIDMEREMVVVKTVGDLWKTYAEGKRACCQSSAISMRPGANTPELTCVDTKEDAARLSLERAQALVAVEGGDKVTAMEKLVAKAQLQTGKSWATVVNMPLAEFVAALTCRADSGMDGEVDTVSLAQADKSITLPAREWPDPQEHTIGKFWTRQDGVICLSTKTDGDHDGTVEFAPTKSGSLTLQMRFMQLMCFKFPVAAALAEVIEQVYSDDYSAANSNAAALQNTLRKLRTLVSNVRAKKFAKAGLNPDILPSLNVDASLRDGICLRLAHLYRLDNYELDEADLPQP